MVWQISEKGRYYEPIKLEIEIEIQNRQIEATNTGKLLRANIDNKLNFEEHIFEPCRKPSMYLNAASCLQNFMSKGQKEAIISSFSFSNFIYCPLLWHFCSCKSQQKKIQLSWWGIVYNDYSSDYQTLSKLSGKPSMEIKRLRNLALEIFKTINGSNPNFRYFRWYFSEDA